MNKRVEVAWPSLSDDERFAIMFVYVLHHLFMSTGFPVVASAIDSVAGLIAERQTFKKYVEGARRGVVNMNKRTGQENARD